MSSGPVNKPLPERCHPYYARRYRRRLLNRAAYVGGDEWYGQGDTYQLGPFTIQPATPGKTGPGQNVGALRESNRLWRHEREKDIRYQRRLRMSAYENVFRPQIDTVAATVAKACRTVEWPPGMEYLEENTDRWGQDAATTRMRRIAWAHVQGEVYTLLEKPAYVEAPVSIEEPGEYATASTEPVPTAPPSRMHELAAGIRTYACLLDPLDLLDWRWDADRMEFVWALIRVSMPAERVAPDEEGTPEPEQCQYTRLYRRSGTDAPGYWVLYKDGKEVDRGTAPPFVPICVQFAVGQDPGQAEPVGLPINDDVTDIVELRFNKSSWLTDEESSHCFSQAFIKTSNPLDAETDQALGNHTYIGADDFKWVSPDTAPMVHLMNSMDRDAMSMRQMQGLETKGETSQAAKSGVALQLESQNTSSLFASYAAAAEAGERAIWRMAARLEGLDPELVKVTYTKDFSALDVAARFSTLMAALALQGGFTGKAKAELLKQVFLGANPEVEPELRDMIFAEIDAEADRAKAASEAQRVQAEAVAARLASGKPAEDDGQEPDDMRPMPGRPTPMAPEDAGKEAA